MNSMRSKPTLIYVVFFLLALTAFLPMVQSTSTGTNVYFSSYSGGAWSTPQIVVTNVTANATGHTFQRNVFYDGTNYFATFWNLTAREIQYVASTAGTSWTAPTIITGFGKYPYGGWDICASNVASHEYALHCTGSDGASSYWTPFNTTGQTLTLASASALTGQQLAHGCSILSNLRGNWDMMIFHRNNTNTIRLHRSPANAQGTSTSISFSATSGGTQLLPYKTADPYHFFALAKGGDNKLYYSLVNETSMTFIGSWTEIATLGAGFDDFYACSEAQSIGASEIVHMTYVKSDGSLAYQNFQSDALSSETVITTGATYPTLTVDTSGNLVLTYVLGGRIYFRTKTPSGSWSAATLLSGDYTDAAYLSSSQNIQSGKITLVWTGTAHTYPAAPAEASPSASVYTNIWLALALASLAMVIVIGLALVSRDVVKIQEAVILGFVVFLCIFVAVIVVSGFQSATG